MRLENPKSKGCLGVLLIAVVIFGLTMAIYLGKSLPPPKVSLSVIGTTLRGTNTLGVVTFNNIGQTIVWPAGGEDVFETKTGLVTNYWPTVTTLFLGLEPSSNQTFYARMPPETLRWSATIRYSNYKRHNLRVETAEKIMKSKYGNRVPTWLWNGLDRCLQWLPTPKEEYRSVSTGYGTNQPTGSLPATNPSAGPDDSGFKK